ncbi:MAG: cytochrome c-type biosis protein CcmF [Solirubrobacteraceae bacterium]|nr:cytochrome c-type biosis protein CcmF [Solirubrobacteraceae bacterium]
MATLGRACVILAFAVALYGIGAGLAAWRLGRRDLAASARRAVYALAGVLTVAMLILELAFLRDDFSFATVASHSSTTTPLFYKLAAVWSSQEGSLLLWVWLLALWSSLVLFLTRKRMRDVTPVATAVLAGFAAFFAGLLVFSASPFHTLGVVPSDGAGLNPLLRHPSMMIHPPMLYSGYTLFTVPFAFAVGALAVGKVDTEWITATRRFALGAWLFLGIGIILGARWSYAELGWGGYWAWDPVENASLLPWLTGTAFIHSIMIQEKRGMLKVWNVSLVLATGILAILGTFLVRSGILDSIHAFGASTLGIPFVVLIVFLIALAIGLVSWRSRLLKTEHRIDSMLSREAAFLFNNLLFVGMAFVVFFGTFFPLITEALGDRRNLGPPWFNRITVPLALGLVGLAGIAPLISWRRVTRANLRRNFVFPVGFGALVVVVLIAAGGVAHKPLALAMFGLGAFLMAGVAQELWRGTRARHAMSADPWPLATVSLVRRNRRRYGGYMVHVGMATLFIGVAASSAFQHNRDVRMRPGQTASIGGYDVRYAKPIGSVVTRDGRVERIDLGAQLVVSKDGHVLKTLEPTRGYYPANAPFAPVSGMFDGESTSEVRMIAGLRRDVWSAVQPELTSVRPVMRLYDRAIRQLAADGKSVNAQVIGFRLGLDKVVQAFNASAPSATFRLIVSPLVAWIWIGGIIVFGGGMVSLWPAPDAARRRATAGYAARVARELGRA